MPPLRLVLWPLAVGAVTACGAQHFDRIGVIVYPRELGGGLEITRLVTKQWGDNLFVTYDPTVIRDLREKRYRITIGRNVFDRYGRDEEKAVQEVTQKIVAEQKLCAKGWSVVSRDVTYYKGGDRGWTILCNEPGT